MSTLRLAYPLLKLDSLCRGCYGNPKIFMKRETCLMCKKNHAAWVKAGYEYEAKEILYLKQLWIKAKGYKQQSTGVPCIDACIVFLFGFPHMGFGVEKPRAMPQKVAVHTPDYVQGPIHLNLTGREKRKLNHVH